MNILCFPWSSVVSWSGAVLYCPYKHGVVLNMNEPHCLDVFSASGASHTQWNSTKPGTAAHPKRDRTEKG